MKPNKLFWILWFVWLFLNFLTGLMQEIYTDESYYHLYGQYLAWGYYDHPPMVGLMAWLSDTVMCHTTMLGWRNLTVRLMTILTHGLTVWLLWKVTTEGRRVSNKTVWTFFMVAAGMVMFCTAGFMTTPDAPLLLFVTLFFYAYQHYLKGQHLWAWSFILCLAIAGMLYSKYMGVLVVAFVVISNWRLMREGRLWLVLLGAFILLMPHLWWQYSHDFPSLQYHLVARNDGIHIEYLLDYWPNQLVVFNPLSLVLMMVLGVYVIRHKDDVFERSLAVTTIGFLAFFWIMTLKGHAEPHWTMAASIPAIILLTRGLEDGWVEWTQRRWVRVTLWIMVGLCTIARIVLWTNKLPINTGLGSKDVRYNLLHEMTGEDRVLITTGSFQWPSMYRFWYGDAFVTHDIHARHTQYEFLDIDLPMQGKKACFCDVFPGCQDTIVDGYTYHFSWVENLQMTDRVRVQMKQQQIVGDSIYWQLQITNPYPVAFDFQHAEMPCHLMVATIQNDGWHMTECALQSGVNNIAAGDSVRYEGKSCWRDMTMDENPQGTKYIFSLYNGLASTENSEVYVIQ